MGYISHDRVSIHHTPKGKIMIKYVFTNKNGQEDYMFVPIPNGYALKIK